MMWEKLNAGGDVSEVAEGMVGWGKIIWGGCSWKMALEREVLWKRAYRNDPNAAPIPCSHALLL